MKHLKIYETNSEDYSIFAKHIETYLEVAYGFYDYKFSYKDGNYTLTAIFVEFDDSSANELNKLSGYLSYNWNLNIEGMQLDDDTVEKFYMVANFDINENDVDLFVEDIKLNNTTKKYNL